MPTTRRPAWRRNRVRSAPDFVANYIEAEAHALLLRELGRTIASQWLLTGGLPVVRVLRPKSRSRREILARHTDRDWTLCDAISFAVLDARRVGRAFRFDHPLQQYGPRTRAFTRTCPLEWMSALDCERQGLDRHPTVDNPRELKPTTCNLRRQLQRTHTRVSVSRRLGGDVPPTVEIQRRLS